MARTKDTRFQRKSVGGKTPRKKKGRDTITTTISKGHGKKGRKSYGEKKPKNARKRHPAISQGGSQRKKRTWKRGTVALREIRKQQKEIGLLFPRRPFVRLIREISQSCPLESESRIRWQKVALEALQQAAESHIIGFFDRAQRAAIHGKRVTVMPRDFYFIRRMCDGTRYSL